MKIVIISDTHNDHEALGSLSGDVLIHCGDFALGGRADHEGIRRVDAWFARQQFHLILCTGGNHDFALAALSARRQPTFAHATYLENQAVTFQGVRFYGAPWLPELRGWAFYQPDAALAEQWAKIPEGTDVLITHTPPYGILDTNSAGWQCGCRALRRRVDELRLRAHCFGHIHASAGVAQRGGTTYVNATMVDRANTIARPPFELTL